MTTSNFIWRDLMSHDPAQARRFYTDLFGWGTRDVELGPHGTYTMWMHGGRALGGLVSFDDRRHDSHWIAYVDTPDIAALLERVVDQGGDVCVPATPIPEVGIFAVVQDAQGALFSPMQRTDARAPTHTYAREAGCFCWAELHTRSRVDADEFYANVFEWGCETRDVGLGVPYSVFADGHPIAGARDDATGDRAPHWLEYVLVDDIERALALAEALEGRVRQEIVEMTGRGRAAVIEDPTGAAIALFENP